MIRTNDIQSIINQREPLAKNVQQAEDNLHKLSQLWHQLEETKDQLLEKIEDETIKGKLNEINFNTYTKEIETQIEVLTKLQIRFKRKTLNIGVVGRARQGKSRLLQSITGLSASEIPDGDHQHCTGVRSTIHHNPHVETYGEVWFYSERTFLDEVITPYYKELNLGTKPLTIQEFANNSLPSLPEIQGAENRAKYEHLKRYHSNFSSYSELLKINSPLHITKNQIREYVSQDDMAGNRNFYNYLAVKEVKIVCSFPNAEIGKITVVDMPGLGDTGIGDEERLIKTLGEDVDFILFVKMPKSSGDYWADVDVKLYDKASSALIDLPLNLWSFMVLNETAEGSKHGNNYHNCQGLIESIDQSHIKVTRCLIANCANPEEVNNKILEPTLDYLASNINNLDQQYASACQDQLRQLKSGIAKELEKARNVFEKVDSYSDYSNESLYSKLFKKFWSDITNELIDDLLGELEQERDYQNDDIREQIAVIFKACREDKAIFPNLEQIKRLKIEKSYSLPAAYHIYLDQIRTQLSLRFLDLGDGLKKSINKVKSKVVNVLVNKLKLGSITTEHDVGFLKEIVTLIPENLQSLKSGFEILANFELSYRGLFQHRIRQQLDQLMPLYAPPITNSNTEQDVLDSLEDLYFETLYKCEEGLKEFSKEPSQASFSIVEEFVDRILRAKDVDEEWRDFLRPFRGEIWSEHFQILGDNSRMKQEWNQLIEQSSNLNQSLSIFTNQ